MARDETDGDDGDGQKQQRDDFGQEIYDVGVDTDLDEKFDDADELHLADDAGPLEDADERVERRRDYLESRLKYVHRDDDGDDDDDTRENDIDELLVERPPRAPGGARGPEVRVFHAGAKPTTGHHNGAPNPTISNRSRDNDTV